MRVALARGAVVAGLLLAPGCSFVVRAPLLPDSRVDCRSAAPVVDTMVAVTIVAVSASVLHAASQEPEQEDFGAAIDAAFAALPAVMALSISPVVVASAIYGYVKTAKCRRRRREGELAERVAQEAADEAAATRASNREQAWTLTKGAATAARADDCAEVLRIGPRVLELDSTFHAVVFARDVAIAHCLWPD